MGGYDVLRGWIIFFAVHPDFKGNRYGQKIMNSLEIDIKKMVCSKINLQICQGNDKVFPFYQKIGFAEDHSISMGKRLEVDHQK